MGSVVASMSAADGSGDGTVGVDSDGAVDTCGSTGTNGVGSGTNGVGSGTEGERSAKKGVVSGTEGVGSGTGTDGAIGVMGALVVSGTTVAPAAAGTEMRDPNNTNVNARAIKSTCSSILTECLAVVCVSFQKRRVDVFVIVANTT
jgi:hypothetical protein